jgi:hypothetical protein
MADNWPVYSLTQAVDRLGPKARSKYDSLRAQIEDAEALQRVCQERLVETERRAAELGHRIATASDPDEVERLGGNLQAVTVRIDKLSIERAKRNATRANVDQIMARLNDFLMSLASQATTVPVPPVISEAEVPKRNDGETVTDAILRIRGDIAAAQRDWLQVRTAPPSPDEIKDVIIAEVDRLGREGKPSYRTDGSKVTINWPDMAYAGAGEALHSPALSASRMMCAMFPVAMVKLLSANLANAAPGLTAAERADHERAITRALFALEVGEERLVEEALNDGLEVHRRISVSGWVLLGGGPQPQQQLAEAAE